METITASTGKVIDPLAVLQACGLHPGMRVADFGCGHGHFSIPAAHIVGQRGSVYAIDLQHDLLKTVESFAKSESLANVEPVWADLEELGSTKIPNGLMDAVLMISNHINSETQHNMMREAARVLKKGGHVYLVEWLGGNTVPFAPAIAERVSKEATIANAHNVGLSVVDEFRPGRYHYGLRLQKV